MTVQTSKNPQVDIAEDNAFFPSGFAPIFPDICYHLTHYRPA
ncbi:hypothetical protein, partial [Escherichia coli]